MLDTLRYFAFGQALFILVITIMIIIRYSYKWAKSPREARVLPIHIVLIGMSYLGLILFAVLEMRARLGYGFSYRIPLSLISFTLGNAALIFMLIHLAVHRMLVTSVLEKSKQEVAEELVNQANATTSKLDEIKSTVDAAIQKVEEVKTVIEN